MINHTPRSTKTDVFLIYDAYNVFIPNNKVNLDEIKFQIRLILSIVSSHGRNNRFVAVLNADDLQLAKIFDDMGYSVAIMNGNRSQELQVFIKKISEEISINPPSQLITISDDPSFDKLFVFAKEHRTIVTVWSPGPDIPAQFSEYDTRLLHELLPSIKVKARAFVRLDAENHLFGLANMGVKVSPDMYVGAIRRLIADLGEIVNIQAVADWDSIRNRLGHNYQRALEQSGIRTIYKVNIPKKSIADITLAGNIQESLDRHPEIDYLVLGTGDGDFLPVVDEIHQHGKKVIILALRQTLSRSLAEAADEIRFLDDYFRVPVTSVDTQPDIKRKLLNIDPNFLVTMKIAHLLLNRKWTYVYYNRLPEEISVDLVEVAVQAGYLRQRIPNGPRAVELNLANPITRQIAYFVKWVNGRLYYCLEKKRRPFCSTKYLVESMFKDQGCQAMGIGQDWKSAIQWLELAEVAMVLRKNTYKPISEGNHMITSWQRNFVHF